jgi:hypothetical protein
MARQGPLDEEALSRLTTSDLLALSQVKARIVTDPNNRGERQLSAFARGTLIRFKVRERNWTLESAL